MNSPDALPERLKTSADGILKTLAEHPSVAGRLAADPAFARCLRHAVACSDYVAHWARRCPEWLVDLPTDESEPPSPDSLRARFAPDAGEVEEAAMAHLRLARHRETLRVAWCDLNRLAEVEQVLRELSDIADAAVGAAVRWCAAQLEARHGLPRDAAGEPQVMVTLAMGKLGGRELNFSSDIDLVFLYPEAGETDGERPLANETFFVRLGQRVVRMLDQVTGEGVVYRTDMRLRPFGDSGPLAVSFDAFETYLQRHGRDWERYAYVKARAVTGEDAAGYVFEQVLRPFVYRRYLDFGVFKSLRDMKALIEREVARRELEDNVKLGPGGIREVEFVVQSFQLVRGGHEPSLREPSLLAVLPRLATRRCLAEEAVGELSAAYAFLRRLENRLQMLDDRQTHDLPEDDTARARVLLAMGLADWPALLEQLGLHRARVRSHFHAAVFAARDDNGDDEALRPFSAAWQAGAAADTAAQLAACGAPQADADAVAERLHNLRNGALYQRMDESGRQRLDAVMPLLLEALCGVDNPAETFERLQGLIEAVCRRSAYLALLRENPAALKRLLDIARRSGFLTAQLATWPMLLDELLDDRLFSAAPDREQLAADLQARLSAEPEDDLEARLDALRAFQRVGTFRVAVADITGTLALMKVSDRLTDIAELALQFSLDMAWRELTARFGVPGCDDGEGGRRPAGFAVVGYGKLGGLELGFGSDLDIVFLHDAEGEGQHTDGERALDNAVFFARLAQRVIHFLSIQTTSGRLYEVDTRLRPSGQSGLLVSSLEAFRRYQREEAWTWEHQALLRARAVAGAPELCAAFEQARVELLVGCVRRDELRERVAEMRERMRRELAVGDDARFDIKQDAGGLADVEFLVQYLVLRHAAEHPALVRWSDNVRQLEALAEAGVMSAQEAGRAADVYRAYRGRLHELSLANRRGVVQADEFASEREWVRARWREVFGDAAAA